MPTIQFRRRHGLVVGSFLILVVLPLLVIGWYLWARAADRYVSRAGFSVHTEETLPAIDLLGGVSALSGSSSSDPEILYRFIQSQELVRSVDEALDLRALWAKGDPKRDPVFAYHPPGTIEDLQRYWQRMVKVYNDGSSGLLEIRVQAFSPEDARKIATEIYEQSSQMINRLSAIARADTTRYALDELNRAVEQLKVARETITRFRNQNQIIDPSTSISSQMGLLSSLKQQLADTLILLNTLQQTTTDQDPRISAARRRIAVIRQMIADENEKIGLGIPKESGSNTGDHAFADLVGEYERVSVDLEFAEQTYTAARASYETAVAEARRKTRYLAAYVRPTLAESPEHPQRLTLFLLAGLFLFLFWAILVLAAYALRDRR
ncbi:MAG TPA: capsule biosynthesis protein [Aliiroseovarius sp.]|nr:capsule biosynthesis protein [Aliiroseovarius sp.]